MLTRRLSFAGLLCGAILLSCFDSRAEEAPTPSTLGAHEIPTYPPCDVEPDERAMAAAKGAFEAGNAAFNEADYGRAITYWEDAYRRDCTAHPMLKNLARAYELNGQAANAIGALQTYLARQPNSGEAASFERRIENLRRKLDESVQAAPPPPPPEEPKPEEPPPPPPQPSPPPPKMSRSPVPLYVAGGGALVGLVGGVLWYPAYSTLQEIEEECPTRGRDEDCARIDEGNQARSDVTLWGIVGGAGAAVAVGGVIWYFAQPEEQQAGSQQAALELSVAPGYAGLRYSAPWTF